MVLVRGKRYEDPKRVLCYTVNERPRARELAPWDIDALCTDRLDRIDAAFFDHAGDVVK
jgi:glycerophosphoryl diester phosphodiesterase